MKVFFVLLVSTIAIVANVKASCDETKCKAKCTGGKPKGCCQKLGKLPLPVAPPTYVVKDPLPKLDDECFCCNSKKSCDSVAKMTNLCDVVKKTSCKAQDPNVQKGMDNIGKVCFAIDMAALNDAFNKD